MTVRACVPAERGRPVVVASISWTSARRRSRISSPRSPTREVSARELTEVALSRIDEVNPAVNAFVAIDAETALAQARGIDERLARGEDVGPLAGIPLGVKDTEDARGFVTTQGSLLHAQDDRRPPPTRCSSIVCGRRDAW